MRIVLSNHAIMRATQRSISIEQITDCITNPDSISHELDQKQCYKKLQDGRMLLLCYTTQDDNTIKVITVILTYKITKYQ